MSSDKCTMEKVSDVWRKCPEDKILDNGNLIMRTFHNEMKKRFRIAPEIVDRFKIDICIMMDIDQTYVKAVEPRETFIDPLGYELTDNVTIFYIDLLLNSGLDQAAYRLGTCEEITQSTYQATLEKTSKKKVDSVMKKVLIEAYMTEEESQAIKQTISSMRLVDDQGVMSVPPLVVEKTLEVTIVAPTEQTIPLSAISKVQPSKSKRKSEKLVEVETSTSKRVKQLSTGQRKKKRKPLLTIDSSSEEEQSEKEEATKEPEKVSAPSLSSRKSRKPWKPKIEKINTAIANDGNFIQMNKFYDLYNDFEKLQIDISTIRYMIRNNVKFDEIKGLVNRKVYDRLTTKKATTKEEDLELQKSMIKISCNTEDEEELKKLLSNLAPYL